MSQQQRQQQQHDDVKTLLPGRTLTLTGYEATVYPMGVRHVRKFLERVVAIADAVGLLARRPGETENEHGERVSAQLVPFALKNAFDIIAECVVLPKNAHIDDVPQWDLPTIIEAWIEESFGEERKWRPWVALLEKTAARFNGGETVSMSEIWSRVSSRLATASPTSTGSRSPAAPTAGGRSRSSSSSPSARSA